MKHTKTETNKVRTAGKAEDRAKHTPGPWEIKSVKPTKPEHSFCARMWIEGVDPVYGQVRLADIPDPDKTQEANARLIAAAPELLALLKEINDEWQNGRTFAVPAGSTFALKVRDAIAKAEGHGASND